MGRDINLFLDQLLDSAGIAHVTQQDCSGDPAILQDEFLAAAIHVGPNPTFGEEEKKVEVHILDFSENIYGDPLEVDFLTRLRDIQPFDGVETLEKQLTLDVARARTYVGDFKPKS